MSERTTKIKSILINLVAEMNIAAQEGFKVEFNISVDAQSLKAKLEFFRAFQLIKDH